MKAKNCLCVQSDQDVDCPVHGLKAKKKLGKRVGTKRRDMRWIDAKGNTWASKFEADVYEVLSTNKTGFVRRCDASDTIHYETDIRKGVCRQCGDTEVYQRHTYTPDLRTSGLWPGYAGELLIEVKGFLRPKDRRILRAVNKAKRTGPPLALLLQREHDKTVAWALKFLKGWKLGVWKTGGIREL